MVLSLVSCPTVLEGLDKVSGWWANSNLLGLVSGLDGHCFFLGGAAVRDFLSFLVRDELYWVSQLKLCLGVIYEDRLSNGNGV